MEQLQRWLKFRGIKQNGERCDFLTRVHDSLKSGNRIVLDPSIDKIENLKTKNTSVLSNIKNNELHIRVVPKSGGKPFLSQAISLLLNHGHVYQVTGRFAHWSFRQPSIRLRLESVRLRPICQFAYDSHVKASKLNCLKVLVESRG